MALAANRGAEMSGEADVAIEVEVGPEIVAGSTRLKAGTAQKLVLNTLSTLTMVQLGAVHGNLMVDVQATNAKLRARAERIVMHATGCDARVSAQALEAADGSAKLAIAIVAGGTDAARAREALAASGGVLREALRTLGASGA
ncbi:MULTISPECIES: N-acetylmuramic acid 6-phosphate etherase [Microbacterium]|uniref:N-acetylmuramic acid 6-phosphate etherase n=1 Tax=Microbacterium TaxID=33882 RepID=UPI00217E0256|nr:MULTISPECIES: N-acetylmuramic acid 6-phosphate etherase [Microbacterium]